MMKEEKSNDIPVDKSDIISMKPLKDNSGSVIIVDFSRDYTVVNVV